MNVNPEDYDPNELRRMAEQRHSDDSDPGSRNGNGRSAAKGDSRQDAGRAAARPSNGGSSFNFGHDDAAVGNQQAAQRGQAAGALRSNQLEQLFLHQSSMSEGQLTKPYLAALPQKYAAERVIFDWLEFLVMKGGFKRAMDALRYYRTIDWITEDVEAALQDYLGGFSAQAENTHEFDVDDHQLSLVYLARLASMN